MKTYILFIENDISLQYAQDCLNSCNQFGLRAGLFLGVKGKTNRELTRMTGYKIHTDQYASEYCGTVGHINIWKEIVASGETGVVLEHDAVVKADYSKLTVNDGEILFLGPRIFNREDYKFPQQYLLSPEYIDVEFYYGAHAYAITPATAQFMLDKINEIKEILMPIDGLLGLRNKFDLKLKTVDPSFVICEIGNRNSFNFDKPDPRNREFFPKFLEGADVSKLPEVEKQYFTTDTFSSNLPHWVETLSIAGKDISQPMEVLEIGSFEGRSTSWISNNMLKHPNSRLDIIDRFNDDLFDVFRKNIAMSKNSDKITPHNGDSRVFLPIFLVQNRKYDFIYVDGSRKIDNIMIDALICSNLLKDNGVIIFSDYGWINEGGFPPVNLALSKLEELSTIKPILSGSQRSYMRVPQP
jgi:GR25 family glycosyltransferase involved in LPS biosynthesis